MEDNKWHFLNVQEACLKLGTSPEQGLSALKAAELLREHGANVLQKKPPRSLLSMFAGQMKDVLVVILIIAATISGLLGEWEDTAVILIIVPATRALGF